MNGMKTMDMNDTSKRNTKEKIKSLIFLHVILAFYSLAAVCSKLASGAEFLSFNFILFYGLLLLILFGYAIAWQQILKRLPLVTAFANKAITVIWGLIWGFVIFGEGFTVPKLIGSAVIISGVVLVVKSDG